MKAAREFRAASLDSRFVGELHRELFPDSQEADPEKQRDAIACHWAGFLAEVARVQIRRDSSPLGDTEKDRLVSSAKAAFEEWAEAEERSEAAGPWESRLRVGASFVAGGFLLLALVLGLLPYYARTASEGIAVEKIEEIGKKLTTALDRLSAPEVRDLAQSADDISEKLNTAKDTLSSIGRLAPELDATSALAGKNWTAIMNSQRAIEAAFDRYFIDSPKLNDSIANIMNREKVDVTELGGALEEVKKSVDELKAIASALPDGGALAWKGGGPATVSTLTLTNVPTDSNSLADWRAKALALTGFAPNALEPFNPSKPALSFNQFMAALQTMKLLQTENLRGLEQTTAEAAARVKATPQTPLAPGESVAITGASTAMKDLKDTLGSGSPPPERLEGLGKSALGSLQSIKDSIAPLTSIAKSSTELVAQLERSSAKIREFSTDLEVRTKAVVEAAEQAKGLGSLGEIVENVSYRTVGPAVVLLIAISGMLVTIGVTSIVRHLRLAEHEAQLRQWRATSKAFTDLSVALIGTGIDPSPLLTQLQARAPAEIDEKDKSIALPVTQTLTELVKLLRSRLR